MVRLQAALGEQLFDIAERERVPKVSAYGAKNQLGLRLSPLEDRRSDCLLHDLFRLPAAAKVATQPENFLRETGFNQGLTDANLQLTERFTRISPGILRYEARVDDPTVWTQSWTYEIPMQKNDQPLYEYACHEGNYGLYNMLAGARQAEKAAEQGASR